MLQDRRSMQMGGCILAKTLLILGAGPDQIPGIIKAKEMGIYTIALDGNANAQGKNIADEFHLVSIKHFQQIKFFIEHTLTKKVDGVIAFGVDIPYVIAQTASLLGVNYTVSPDVAQMSEDKFLSKEFMANLKLNIPPYQRVQSSNEIDDFLKEHGFPIIVKPVDNSAARGISFINSPTNIEQAFNEAFQNTSNESILIEKYLNGQQISTESFIVNGKIFNIGFADRNYNNMERFFPHIIENGGDLPSLYMNDAHKKSLSQQLQLIIDALHIKNAVIKGDLVLHNDKVFIIEFALRLSGGNFSTIEIPENTGVDFLKIAIKLHLNESIAESELIQTKNNYVSLRYKFNEDSEIGTIQDIIYPEKNDDIILQKFHATKGQVITSKTTDHAKRLGFVIAKGKTRELAIQNAQQQLQKIRVSID